MNVPSLTHIFIKNAYMNKTQCFKINGSKFCWKKATLQHNAGILNQTDRFKLPDLYKNAEGPYITLRQDSLTQIRREVSTK